MKTAPRWLFLPTYRAVIVSVETKRWQPGNLFKKVEEIIVFWGKTYFNSKMFFSSFWRKKSFEIFVCFIEIKKKQFSETIERWILFDSNSNNWKCSRNYPITLVEKSIWQTEEHRNPFQLQLIITGKQLHLTARERKRDCLSFHAYAFVGWWKIYCRRHR